jgi:hypothetical protein
MKSCIFCQIAAGHPLHSALTVFENEHVFVQVSLSQKRGNQGHALVIPKRHIRNIYELPEELDALLDDPACRKRKPYTKPTQPHNRGEGGYWGARWNNVESEVGDPIAEG